MSWARKEKILLLKTSKRQTQELESQISGRYAD